MNLPLKPLHRSLRVRSPKNCRWFSSAKSVIKDFVTQLSI